MYQAGENSTLTDERLRTLGIRKLAEVVCGWERAEYGIGMHRQPVHLQAMIEKNRDGMLCIFEDGDLIAYADIWQLETGFYEELRSGRISEEEIRAKHILARGDKPSERWYVGSIITSPVIRSLNPEKGNNTFQKIYTAILGFSSAFGENYKIFGVASSPFGEKLLSRFHFRRTEPARDAIDMRPRFELALSGKARKLIGEDRLSQAIESCLSVSA